LRKLRIYFTLLLLFLATENINGQTLTHQFTDPCTGQVTYFSVPATGTVIFFLGQSRQFTSADELMFKVEYLPLGLIKFMLITVKYLLVDSSKDK